MDIISRISPWLNRLILAFATFIFVMISMRNLFDPVKANAVFKISLNSPEAITNTRIGFGAFPLVFAIIMFVCLLSTKRHLAGLLMLATLAGTLTIVRIGGIIADGPAEWTLHVLKPEIAMFTFSVIALILEFRRRERAPRVNYTNN